MDEARREEILQAAKEQLDHHKYILNLIDVKRDATIATISDLEGLISSVESNAAVV